jgi:ferrochelatase
MIGVLMMAHGTPERLEQMEEYLSRIRGGRRPSPELLEEMTGNYRAIGGRSPLTDLTLAQGSALEGALGEPYRVFVGMRNWHPFIADVVPEILDAGAKSIVGLTMAPQYSELSVAKYLSALESVVPADFPTVSVRSWYDHPGVMDAFAERARQAIEESGPVDRIVFTAHSLPKRVKDSGDPPYPVQVRVTAEGVAKRLGFSRWQVAYQSAGRTPEPWLGPDPLEALDEMAASRCRRVLVVPVGFVCDHTEILFDIDIQANRAAQEIGIELVRSPSLNSSPTFIRALADIVRSRIES